ncbi:hypothetical protein BDQ12DRAFT_605108 [Crucibulum laeve]|uniref:CxC6 like cysteine cluster associated with KDZ domain-containing protein n=1 Tax=Crucibulum laeve TaxID=68775 RepID=A0A5C3M073_9AGAR|nr:hypothetical protein BDQ12DRAFT_605108 [Crucibulum laeve]
MVVVDGIVIGPQHCAYDGCTADLANGHGGVFCAFHESAYGESCRVHHCQNIKESDTQVCHQHQQEWSKHKFNQNQKTLSGIKRVLQWPGEQMPWQPNIARDVQAHDVPTPDVQQKNYFSASHFYCVETICAPCGVVIAWTKFDRAESSTNILEFLEAVYPTEDSRPDYVCIDKACMVLRSSISNRSWETWKKTTRFIVDSYHYINHCKTDFLCHKWCNPAPLDGSAPNLVVGATGKNGEVYYKQAFNTQACEQLNAWLGGFESILKRMTPSNFNWFLHTVLFYHTVHVIEKQT